MAMNRTPYVKPGLIIHGTIEQITLQGGRPNADLPGGSDGTAFSPG